MNFQFALRSLIAVICIKAVFMSGLILTGIIGLGPDEAQYWTWSQFLDWGYYSKPPAIAWQIRVGTDFFGNSELGVRILSVLIAALLSLSVFWLAIACRCQPRTALWSGIVMALCPLGFMASLFAITDVGMVLFWSLGCIVIAQAISTRQSPNYYLLGIIIFLGALFKWPAYLFWLIVIGCFPFCRYLINKQMIYGVLISLLGLLPSLIWNIQHNWVTFRHVGATIAGSHGKEIGTTDLFHGNLFDFLGAQAALLSPIPFIIFLFAAIHLIRKRTEIPAPLLFCGASSLALLTVYSLLSIVQKMQGNWCDFAYPSAIVFLCWYACEHMRYGEMWLKIGVGFSILISLFGFSIPYIQSQSTSTPFAIPYKMNPFRQNVGWNNLNKELQDVGYNPKEHFLFGDKYQMSSILSFYGPGQKRAYFLNMHHIRNNQFSFWPSMAEEQLGKTGFFVLADNSPHLEKDMKERVAFYQGALSQYFGEVQFLGIKPLFMSNGKMGKGALIFKCMNYNGLQPPDSHLY